LDYVQILKPLRRNFTFTFLIAMKVRSLSTSFFHPSHPSEDLSELEADYIF
jgi:hypothetical protein